MRVKDELACIIQCGYACTPVTTSSNMKDSMPSKTVILIEGGAMEPHHNSLLRMACSTAVHDLNPDARWCHSSSSLLARADKHIERLMPLLRTAGRVLLILGRNSMERCASRLQELFRDLASVLIVAVGSNSWTVAHACAAARVAAVGFLHDESSLLEAMGVVRSLMQPRAPRGVVLTPDHSAVLTEMALAQGGSMTTISRLCQATQWCRGDALPFASATHAEECCSLPRLEMQCSLESAASARAIVLAILDVAREQPIPLCVFQSTRAPYYSATKATAALVARMLERCADRSLLIAVHRAGNRGAEVALCSRTVVIPPYALLYKARLLRSSVLQLQKEHRWQSPSCGLQMPESSYAVPARYSTTAPTVESNRM